MKICIPSADSLEHIEDNFEIPSEFAIETPTENACPNCMLGHEVFNEFEQLDFDSLQNPLFCNVLSSVMFFNKVLFRSMSSQVNIN